jgi:hypothetical protein
VVDVRKRMVIVAAGVVVMIAVATLVARSQTPIEQHIDGYRAAFIRLRSPATLSQKVGDALRRLVGKEGSYGLHELQKHQNALVRLGYMEERTFAITNRPAAYVCSNAWDQVFFQGDRDMSDFTPMFHHEGTNRIRVLARTQDIPKWEAVIRKWDVPEIE